MKKILIILSLLLFFAPALSFAADIFFSADKNSFTENEDFLVQVYIDAKDVQINATEGVVIFPDNLLDVKEIRDGNSTINFWVEKPQDMGDGKISFSGITTGGFSGPKMFLFGIVFHSKKVGASTIAFKDIQVLQNDGLGTNVPTATNTYAFSVSTEPSGITKNLTVEDTEPPENFTPFVTTDPSIFDGKYFLVFNAVDKGTGIDHYEVHEGFLTKFIVAKNPYLLEDQTLSKNIYIKAVDKSGNQRLVRIKSQNPSNISWLELGLILGIILFICFLLTKKRWSKVTPK